MCPFPFFSPRHSGRPSSLALLVGTATALCAPSVCRAAVYEPAEKGLSREVCRHKPDRQKVGCALKKKQWHWVGSLLSDNPDLLNQADRYGYYPLDWVPPHHTVYQKLRGAGAIHSSVARLQKAKRGVAYHVESDPRLFPCLTFHLGDTFYVPTTRGTAISWDGGWRQELPFYDFDPRTGDTGGLWPWPGLPEQAREKLPFSEQLFLRGAPGSYVLLYREEKYTYPYGIVLPAWWIAETDTPCLCCAAESDSVVSIGGLQVRNVVRPDAIQEESFTIPGRNLTRRERRKGPEGIRLAAKARSLPAHRTGRDLAPDFYNKSIEFEQWYMIVTPEKKLRPCFRVETRDRWYALDCSSFLAGPPENRVRYVAVAYNKESSYEDMITVYCLPEAVLEGRKKLQVSSKSLLPPDAPLAPCCMQRVPVSDNNKIRSIHLNRTGIVCRVGQSDLYFLPFYPSSLLVAGYCRRYGRGEAEASCKLPLELERLISAFLLLLGPPVRMDPQQVPWSTAPGGVMDLLQKSGQALSQ